jgi:hypothetical protein
MVDEMRLVSGKSAEQEWSSFLQFSAKKEKSRRCLQVPETCMLVDGAYGNTVQQKKWANDAN